MRFRRRVNVCCAWCGRPPIVWPSYFSDEFYELHRCPSGRGHFFFDPERRGWRVPPPLSYAGPGGPTRHPPPRIRTADTVRNFFGKRRVGRFSF